VFFHFAFLDFSVAAKLTVATNVFTAVFLNL